MFPLKDSKGHNRYVGASKAAVIDNRDPLERRRIRVHHPLLGDTSWIDYLNDFGTYSMPAVGDIVYVQCDTGHYEFPFAWGNVPKGYANQPNTPTPFKRTVPTNRGFYSPGGNFIEMDDGEAAAGADPTYSKLTTKNRGIRITSKSGHSIEISDDPDNGKEWIVIRDKEGDGIVIDSAEKKVTIVSKGKFSLDAADTLEVVAHKDMSVNVTDAESHITKSFIVLADDTLQLTGSNAKFSGSSGTKLGDAGSTTEVQGTQVMLAGGGPGVARLGDRTMGIGNLGFPVSSVVIMGSSKVLSG